MATKKTSIKRFSALKNNPDQQHNKFGNGFSDSREGIVTT